MTVGPASRTEFGRSPRISNAGRDHWPACYSAMLAGGGIRGGLAYGASDAHGRVGPANPQVFLNGSMIFLARKK